MSEGLEPHVEDGVVCVSSWCFTVNSVGLLACEHTPAAETPSTSVSDAPGEDASSGRHTKAHQRQNTGIPLLRRIMMIVG